MKPTFFFDKRRPCVKLSVNNIGNYIFCQIDTGCDLSLLILLSEGEWEEKRQYVNEYDMITLADGTKAGALVEYCCVYWINGIENDVRVTYVASKRRDNDKTKATSKAILGLGLLSGYRMLIDYCDEEVKIENCFSRK